MAQEVQGVEEVMVQYQLLKLLAALQSLRSCGWAPNEVKTCECQDMGINESTILSNLTYMSSLHLVPTIVSISLL